MFLDLESSLKVAKSSMNQHHKEEVDAINWFYIACKEGKEEEIERALEMSVKRTKGHFSHEEELMKKRTSLPIPCTRRSMTA